MHILVKTLTGKTVNIQSNNSSSVESFKSQVEAVIGVPSDEQKLIHNGSCLENGKLLTDYSVSEESYIYLVISLEGGAKGKKKKKDKKPIKKKHKKRKVKLAILRYYKVEGDRVNRIRQMCKVCPPGTFIADHKDRLYCGRCHTTYGKVAESKGTGGQQASTKGKGGKK
jgi:small subunit ribosomal protein S27Ae